MRDLDEARMQLAMAVRWHIVASGLSLLIIASQTHDTANALIGADIADISLRQYTVAVASMKGRCTGAVLTQDIVRTARALCAGRIQSLGRRQSRLW
jgi:hypothetical protein